VRLIHGCSMLKELDVEVDTYVLNQVCQSSQRFSPSTLILNADFKREHYPPQEDSAFYILGNQSRLYNFLNPFLCTILSGLGSGLTDITVCGESFSQECFEFIPNITALRLYNHHWYCRDLIPTYQQCRFMVCLELVSTSTRTGEIIGTLAGCGYTSLRALAIYNTLREDAVSNYLLNAEIFESLGTACYCVPTPGFYDEIIKKHVQKGFTKNLMIPFTVRETFFFCQFQEKNNLKNVFQKCSAVCLGLLKNRKEYTLQRSYLKKLLHSNASLLCVKAIRKFRKLL